MCDCADIDECATDNQDCSSKAECINTAGSYVCICNPGYTGDGQTCVGKYMQTPIYSVCESLILIKFNVFNVIFLLID